MKIFIYILLVFSIGLMIFNLTKLDFENLMQGDSFTALVTAGGAACVMVLLLILIVSRRISEKVK